MPLLTNATSTRFLFGAFRLEDDAPVFDGSVVFGAGLTYDPVTGHPMGGNIHRIAHQIRSETRVLVTCATIDYPSHDVALLNHVYEDQPTAWFDPAILFQTAPNEPQDTTADLTDEIAASMQLGTGDVITPDELRDIYGKNPRRVRRLARRMPKVDRDFLDINMDVAPAAHATA